MGLDPGEGLFPIPQFPECFGRVIDEAASGRLWVSDELIDLDGLGGGEESVIVAFHEEHTVGRFGDNGGGGDVNSLS